MLPFVTIAGRVFPTYGLCCMLGLAAAMLLVCLRARRFYNSADDSAYLLIWIVIGAMVGAKIVYILTVLPQFCTDLRWALSDPGRFAALYLSGGFVFYGGVIGGFASAFLAARYFRLRLVDYIAQFTPAIQLAHAIGRIGCFATGCCYGIPFHPGIVYHHAVAGPNNVELFPVQLLEAAAELLIFVVLMVATDKGLSGWDPLALYIGLYSVYIGLYSVVQFSDEFLRGDAIRGIFGGLSTSQWISLLAFIAVIVYIACRPRLARAADSRSHGGTSGAPGAPGAHGTSGTSGTHGVPALGTSDGPADPTA